MHFIVGFNLQTTLQRVDRGLGTYLAQRPRGMAAHQRLGIVECINQPRHRFLRFQIAERDGDIAQEASTFGASDRTTAKALAEIGVGQRQQRDQLRCQET